VVTIAGSANNKGYVDGTGKAARFSGPWGIERTDDNNLYVAEVFNNKIRKITPSGVVSTIKIPERSDHTSLRNPIVIRIDKDGTKYILALEYTYTFKYHVWIVKPNGQLLTPLNHPNEFLYDIAKDPYQDLYWTSGGKLDNSNNPHGVVEKFLIDSKGLIGTNPYSPPNSSLVQYYDQQYPSITSIFCGYNGVKYLIVNQQHIYKLTSSGQFAQIYKNYNFQGIYSIIATKDSQTIYIASNGGSIYRIFNNQLQLLVGQHSPYNGHDGVGAGADVTAHHMVLSKDEKTLFFTDYSHNTIRKLILKN
jgi:hypothetical protein